MLEEEEMRLVPILMILAENPDPRTDPRKPAQPDEECFLKKRGILLF